MLHHVVFFKLVDSATDADRRAMIDGLNSLPALIPEIASFECGETLDPARSNCELVLTATFRDREAYQVYADNAVHQALAIDLLRPKSQEIRGAQFETP